MALNVLGDFKNIIRNKISIIYIYSSDLRSPARLTRARPCASLLSQSFCRRSSSSEAELKSNRLVNLRGSTLAESPSDFGRNCGR